MREIKAGSKDGRYRTSIKTNPRKDDEFIMAPVWTFLICNVKNVEPAYIYDLFQANESVCDFP